MKPKYKCRTISMMSPSHCHTLLIAPQLIINKQLHMSWLRQVRALPLNPALNDILKVEYLDVNLNNSRKLMANVASLGVEAKQLTQHEEDTVEAMLQLKNLRNELSWTDSVR